MATKMNIPMGLQSTELNGYVAAADQVKDESLNKLQSVINQQIENRVAALESGGGTKFHVNSSQSSAVLADIYPGEGLVVEEGHLRVAGNTLQVVNLINTAYAAPLDELDPAGAAALLNYLSTSCGVNKTSAPYLKALLLVNNYETYVLCQSLEFDNNGNLAGFVYQIGTHTFHFTASGNANITPTAVKSSAGNRIDTLTISSDFSVAGNTLVSQLRGRSNVFNKDEVIIENVVLGNNLQTRATGGVCYIDAIGLPDSIIAERDGLYQKKDNEVYPMAHPDLSTQPSTLAQRYGNLNISEVLVPLGRYGAVATSVDTTIIPLTSMVIECSMFCAEMCVPCKAYKDSQAWHIVADTAAEWDETNLPAADQWWALVRFTTPRGGYYGSGGEQSIPTFNLKDLPQFASEGFDMTDTSSTSTYPIQNFIAPALMDAYGDSKPAQMYIDDGVNGTFLCTLDWDYDQRMPCVEYTINDTTFHMTYEYGIERV